MKSFAISKDERFVFSGSNDEKIKLWNTLGDLKHTAMPEKFAQITSLFYVDELQKLIVGDSEG